MTAKSQFLENRAKHFRWLPNGPSVISLVKNNHGGGQS